MTTDEFLLELESVSSHFLWSLVPDTRGWTERRRSPRMHIQAALRGEPSAVFDPLAAVCYVRTGKAIEAKYWPEAARNLGLETSQGALLVAAAHDRTWEDAGDGSRRPVPGLLALRQRILESTGLLRVRPSGPTASGEHQPSAFLS